MKEGNADSTEKSIDPPVHKKKILVNDPQAELAEQLGMDILTDLSEITVSKERFKQVPYSFAKKHTILPIKDEGDLVIVAVADPLNLSPIEEMRFLLNCEIDAVYSPREIILSAIHDCYDTEEGAASQIIADLSDKNEDGRDGEVEVYDLLDQSRQQSPIIQLLNFILTEAIQQGASDIHFEPSENGMRVRYRIDGVLQNRHAPSQDYQIQLLTRIKVMSKLDIAEHRLPQDGRIKLRMGRREIDFRVSTVPIAGGERIVMRILDKGNVLLGMDKIGMLPTVFEQFIRLIDLPEGIVLVTGPTGSGKTTTLYSAICEMANDQINIMTIEDPVEYNLKGIAQIGVHHKIKLDFATGLRHILRQDPDVIMVGEIRDKETAEIAIQAALTGHLVLSTLHTNDAPSAITRLVDMGIEPYLLSSCIVGVLAQRLVRRICPECKEAYQPSLKELQSIGLKQEDLIDNCLYHGIGCAYCYQTGFKGRQGVYELMPVTNAINKQIVQSPDAIEMRKVAIEEGMISLLRHGAELVRNGQTTVAEVLRVARGIEEQG
ncbi:MAG: type II secretion system ATPase GspE [Parachlamydiaceae bacterium]|nr:type II secretion system ATPase GspE [Parachlamydiaceae bacterium]